MGHDTVFFCSIEYIKNDAGAIGEIAGPVSFKGNKVGVYMMYPFVIAGTGLNMFPPEISFRKWYLSVMKNGK